MSFARLASQRTCLLANSTQKHSLKFRSNVPCVTVIGAQRHFGMPPRQNTKFPAALSPHVFIYDWPLAALSSVTYRATGAMLCVGMYGIGMASLVSDTTALIQGMQTSMPLLMGPVAKGVVGFPLAYHYLGAIRHLYWERNPSGLGTESIHQSSTVLIGASVVSTLGLMALSLDAKK
eukprot:g5919.t1